MENSLGLDVHGAPETQDQGQPSEEEAAVSWGIMLHQDDALNQDPESWGILADTGQDDLIWGGNAAESWGLVEEASTTKQDDESKKEKVDDWGTVEEEGGTTQRDDKSKKDKGTPYVPATPPARAKMSPEELAERMEKIRLQNEKIKERREHVKADEEAFNTSVAADRARQAANRKVQAQINQNREQNAKKKLEKMGNREWDSEKQGGEWKQSARGRGRGRGRGSFGSGKDKGRQYTTANPRSSVDVSTKADSNTPLSPEDPPSNASESS